MEKWSKFVGALSEWSGRLFAYLFWPGTAVLIYEVIARYFFNAPTIWASGTSMRIFAAYYFIGGAYVTLHKSHIRMDVIYDHFPARTKAIVDLFGTFLMIAYCGVLLWWGGLYAWNSLINFEPDNTPFHAPLYPVKLMIPLGALLLLLQESAEFCRNLLMAISGRGYER